MGRAAGGSLAFTYRRLAHREKGRIPRRKGIRSLRDAEISSPVRRARHQFSWRRATRRLLWCSPPLSGREQVTAGPEARCRTGSRCLSRRDYGAACGPPAISHKQSPSSPWPGSAWDRNHDRRLSVRVEQIDVQAKQVEVQRPQNESQHLAGALMVGGTEGQRGWTGRPSGSRRALLLYLLARRFARPFAVRPLPRARAAFPLAPAERLPVNFENASSIRPADLSKALGLFASPRFHRPSLSASCLETHPPVSPRRPHEPVRGLSGLAHQHRETAPDRDLSGVIKQHLGEEARH
jgi:hypothetical protein